MRTLRNAVVFSTSRVRGELRAVIQMDARDLLQIAAAKGTLNKRPTAVKINNDLTIYPEHWESLGWWPQGQRYSIYVYSKEPK